MRLSRADWRRIPDASVRADYERVEQALLLPAGGRMGRRRCLAATMNLLYQYALLYNHDTGSDHDHHPATLANLNRFHEGEVRAREAWARLREHWCSAGHLRDARTRLSRALLVLGQEAMALVVNPVLRRQGVVGGGRRRCSIEFENRCAQTRRFALHDCIPLSVRRLGTDSVRYLVLCHFGREVASQLRSTSMHNLKWILLFLNGIIFEGGGAPMPDDAHAVQRLCHRWGPMEWLERYATSHAPPGRCISFDLFRRELRLLRILHGQVMHGERVVDPPPLSIPVPRCNWWRDNSAGEDPARRHDNVLAAASSSSLGSGDEEDDHDLAEQLRQRRERQALRTAVAQLRGRLVGRSSPDDGTPPEARLKTFRPDEVRAIVAAAVTPLERVVIMLFITTGLRRGGLCLLALPGGPAAGAPGTLAEVPTSLHTVEKCGRRREITLGPTMRWLVWCWLRQPERSGRPNAVYLLPARNDPSRPMARNRVWQICREIFKRAGLGAQRGGRLPSYAHPHTFRHTTVKML